VGDEQISTEDRISTEDYFMPTERSAPTPMRRSRSCRCSMELLEHSFDGKHDGVGCDG
jgi:hypothetical protein